MPSLFSALIAALMGTFVAVLMMQHQRRMFEERLKEEAQRNAELVAALRVSLAKMLDAEKGNSACARNFGKVSRTSGTWNLAARIAHQKIHKSAI